MKFIVLNAVFQQTCTVYKVYKIKKKYFKLKLQEKLHTQYKISMIINISLVFTLALRYIFLFHLYGIGYTYRCEKKSAKKKSGQAICYI